MIVERVKTREKRRGDGVICIKTSCESLEGVAGAVVRLDEVAPKLTTKEGPKHLVGTTITCGGYR
jgi:hypothetical protein